MFYGKIGETDMIKVIYIHLLASCTLRYKIIRVTTFVPLATIWQALLMSYHVITAHNNCEVEIIRIL